MGNAREKGRGSILQGRSRTIDGGCTRRGVSANDEPDQKNYIGVIRRYKCLFIYS